MYTSARTPRRSENCQFLGKYQSSEVDLLSWAALANHKMTVPFLFSNIKKKLTTFVDRRGCFRWLIFGLCCTKLVAVHALFCFSTVSLCFGLCSMLFENYRYRCALEVGCNSDLTQEVLNHVPVWHWSDSHTWLCECPAESCVQILDVSRMFTC